MQNYPDTDTYILAQDKAVQPILQQIRKEIQKAAPDAIEKISYGMPAYDYFGVLVYFAAWKNHIGFYALPDTNIQFKKELMPYRIAKGSIQFQLSEPIPFALIRKIVALRVKENLAKKKAKKAGKK
jgi:uncharacterized protein YdhG (YjbR/CyaY superfamily)